MVLPPVTAIVQIGMMLVLAVIGMIAIAVVSLMH